MLSTSSFGNAAYIAAGIALLWLTSALCGLLAIRLWSRMKGGFSLRDLFVDMTLVAVLIGLMAWIFG